MQKRWPCFIFALITMMVLSFGGCTSSSDDYSPYYPETGTIELNNYSDVTIDRFYLAPVHQTSWGRNILRDVLYPGESTLIVDIESGYYDARISVIGLYSDYFGYLYDINMRHGRDVVLDVYNSSFTGSLEIYNDTIGAHIVGVYVVPAGSPTWGHNQTTSSIYPGEDLHLSDLSPGFYDIRIVWNVGPDSYYDDVKIKSLTLITIDVD